MDPVTVIIHFDNDTELVVDLAAEEWESLDDAFSGPRAVAVWRGITAADEAIAVRLTSVLALRTNP